MPSNYISKLKMADNTEYLIKDAALTSRVDALEIAGFEAKVYATLPTPSNNTMHIIALIQEAGTTSGTYTEYVTVRSGTEGSYTYAWERIGTTSTDLTDYLKASEVTTATGTVTVSSEGHTHTYDKTTGATYTSTSANLSINSLSFTPEGSVDLTYSGGTGGDEYTGTNTCGISASPSHTSTALSLTDAGHTHGVGTLAGSVGTGITLTANGSTATGRIKYVEAVALTANTPTAVTLPTYTAGSVTLPTRATHAVMSDTYTYDSATETLTFSSENVYEMTSDGSYTAPTWTAGSVTAGTAASLSTNTTKYLSAALTSGSVTITGSTASGTASVSGNYDKTTSISISDTGHAHTYKKTLSAEFTGTQDTITPTGTVSYDKATGFTYTSNNTGSTSTGKAGTYNVSGGSVVTISH